MKTAAISLNLGEGKIALVSCYLLSGETLLAADLFAKRDLGQSVIAAGDFNSKHIDWECQRANGNGFILRRLIDEFNDTHTTTRGVVDILDGRKRLEKNP